MWPKNSATCSVVKRRETAVMVDFMPASCGFAVLQYVLNYHCLVLFDSGARDLCDSAASFPSSEEDASGR